MMVREGKIPTYLGVAVTAAGFALRGVNPAVGYGLAGFGLAHILLGSIDMVQHPTRDY